MSLTVEQIQRYLVECRLQLAVVERRREACVGVIVALERLLAAVTDDPSKWYPLRRELELRELDRKLAQGAR